MVLDGNLVAIVTGAGGLISLDICKTLVENHYFVCLSDIDEQRARCSHRVLEKIYGSGKSIYVKCDVSSKEELRAVFDMTVNKFGKIDLLINNVGILDEQDPERTVDVNLMGMIYGCQLAFEYMNKKKNANGTFVINISSLSGLLPYFGAPTYVATRHAIIGLTRSYGHEINFNNSGITFAAICPHYTDPSIYVSVLNHDTVVKEHLAVRNVYPMDHSRATDSVMKILRDKINGSVLLVLEDKIDYEKIPEHLQNIPTALH